jgi:N-acetyl-gamma-glutamyl-phosphate reductase
MKKKINVGIVGITGYTGEELLKLLSKHPQAEIAVLMGRSSAETKPLKDVYPQFEQLDLCVESLDAASLAARTDVVFLALPHRVSFGIAPDILKEGKKVIDLSADFRLKRADVYEKWYGEKHTADGLLPAAVYGLPEINREKIKAAKLIANPGCYPTTVILGLMPVLRQRLVDLSTIIIDAKSGISGAGRKAVAEYFKAEHPNFRPYNIAGGHRHIPEIEQELSNVSGGKSVIVTFTPHIMPMERGMLSTVYADLEETISTADVAALYTEFYRNEPFVRVLPAGDIPRVNNVVNTNFCEIGVKVDERTHRLIIVSAIDNLVKGASGQAVQNMNIMFGFDEKDGLI